MYNRFEHDLWEKAKKMQEKLKSIYELASADIEKAQTSADLDDIKLKYLTRQGELNTIKKGLKDLSIEEKKIVGSLANEITQKLESAVADKYKQFYRKELDGRGTALTVYRHIVDSLKSR